MKRLLTVLIVSGGLAIPVVAQADPLPPNCERVQGEVTCTTTEQPGKNQGGVGSTSTVETQGNTKNKNPAPQDLEDECAQRPAKSQGGFSCP
jgi:hypothetical protein